MINKKLKNLASVLDRMGLKKEASEVYNFSKIALTPDIIHDPDLSAQTANYESELDDDNFAEMFKDFMISAGLEAAFEIPAAGYYIGDALWKEDYSGAAIEGLASAVPFLPKAVVSKILRFVLPRKWQSLDMLNDALREAGHNPEEFKKIKDELNRRHKKLVDMQEDGTLALPDGSGRLALPDNSMLKSADDVYDAPTFIQGRGGAYKFDPKINYAQCDSSKLQRLEDYPTQSLDERYASQILSGASAQINRVPVRINSSKHEEIVSSLKNLYEEFDRVQHQDSVLGRMEVLYDYQRVGDHKQIFERSKELLEESTDSFNRSKKYLKETGIPGKQSAVLSRKELLEEAKANAKNFGEIQYASARLDTAQRDLRQEMLSLKRAEETIEYNTRAIEILDEVALPAVRQADVSNNVSRVAIQTRLGNSIDMTNLPEFYNSQLKNQALKINVYSGYNARKIISESKMGRVDLPDTFKIEDGKLYHSPQGVKINSISNDDLIKIIEVSRINSQQSAGRNPNNVIKSLDFL